MTTDMATTIADVRRILNDRPDEDYTTAAIVDAAATVMTVSDVTKWAKGQEWEFDDGTSTAERVLVLGVDTSSDTITVKRGHHNSPPATHASGVTLLKEPRFPYDVAAQAITSIINVDLFQNGIYDIAEHILDSSPVSRYYDAPTAFCEEFLWVYQVVSVDDPPMSIEDFDRQYHNVDTSLYPSGRVFGIRQNYGQPGVDVYYINCKHFYTISTLDAIHEAPYDIVKFLAAAYLLEWTEPRRTAGPANQGDTTVRPGQAIAEAQYFRALAKSAIQNEKSYLKGMTPPYRVFKKF